MLMPKRAYYNENIRCYSNGKIERLNKKGSKFGKAGTWREVKQTSFCGNGYLKIGIDGKSMKWHRVIWMAFNGEIPDELTINHKDENKTNNSLSNLEIMTRGDNARYSHLNGKFSKPIIGINIKTEEKIEFPSIKEAHRNGLDGRNICKCLKGRIKTAYGYKWYYKNEEE